MDVDKSVFMRNSESGFLSNTISPQNTGNLGFGKQSMISENQDKSLLGSSRRMISKGKCKTSADVTNVLNASGVVEGSLDISKRQSTFQGSTYTLNSHNRSNVSQFKQETIACHRKFKNSPKEINNFFFNLCKFKDSKDQKELSHKRSKSGG